MLAGTQETFYIGPTASSEKKSNLHNNQAIY
jgi:hypothetical protein